MLRATPVDTVVVILTLIRSFQLKQSVVILQSRVFQVLFKDGPYACCPHRWPGCLLILLRPYLLLRHVRYQPHHGRHVYRELLQVFNVVLNRANAILIRLLPYVAP